MTIMIVIHLEMLTSFFSCARYYKTKRMGEVWMDEAGYSSKQKITENLNE